MDLIIIGIAAFGASTLTFFSGFGLGTLLMPVLAIFFPLPIAISITAIVHFLNNVFKFFLVGKHLHKGIVLRFGLPALAAAFFGARLLTLFDGVPPLAHYNLLGKTAEISCLKLIIAGLLLLFVWLEGLSVIKKGLKEKHLTTGGLLSGFFGGLSGHQGALRSAFLIQMGLSKESFIATGIAISFCVDISRLAVYTHKYLPALNASYLIAIAIACLSAFLGAFLGRGLLKKTTIASVHAVVNVMLVLIAILLAAGVI